MPCVEVDSDARRSTLDFRLSLNSVVDGNCRDEWKEKEGWEE